MEEALYGLYIIELLSTHDEQSGWMHHYLQIPVQSYQDFKRAISSGPIDLEQFGEIIYSGEGREPNEQVKQELEKELKVDHHFQAKVESLVFSDEVSA